jgi:hypothetical protein
MRISVLLISVLFNFLSAAQDKVHLAINPVTAEVGETFKIAVTTTEAGTIDFGELPEAFLQDYAIEQGSTQHQNAQGKMSVQHYYRISGIIKKPGNYTFGPVTLTHGNKTYVSNTVEVHIRPKLQMKGSPISRQQFRDPAFGILEVNKTTLYEGEPILVRAKLFARYKPTHISNYQGYDVSGSLLKHPINSGGRLKTIIKPLKGENFYTIDYDKNVLFPTTVGTIEIKPYRLNLNYNYQTFPVESSTLSLNVLPLPANPPGDFIGAVGSYRVERELETKKMKQGDVIKLLVTIHGVGNLHNITAPNLNLPTGFAIYGDPVVKEDYNFGVRGSEGQIQYEYNIEVTASGETSLPPTSISFFDPVKESYVTVQTQGDSISITPNDNFVADSAQENDKQRTNELVVQQFKVREDEGSIPPGSIYGTPLFWGGVTLPLTTAFLFLLFVRSKTQSEKRKKERKRKQEQSAALHTVMSATKAAVNHPDTLVFYDAIDKAIRTLYANQMHTEGQPSKSEILDYAEKKDAQLFENTKQLFSQIEVAKFGFGANPDSRKVDLLTLESILKMLNNTK